MSAVICPLCDTENPVDATHCVNCRVNLPLALKNPGEIERIRRESSQPCDSTREESPPVRAADSALGERPGCVTLYAVFLGITAGLTAITGITSFSGLIAGYNSRNSSLGVIQAAGALVLAGLALLLAKGLWQLKNWARITVIVIQSLGVLISVLLFRVFGMGYAREGLSNEVDPFHLILMIIWGIMLCVIPGYIIYWFASHRECFRR